MRRLFVHEWFCSNARRSPGSVAIESGSTTLTYRQLDYASSCLALEIRSAGAKPGEAIAILVHCRIETIIAVIAAMKAGNPFIPIPSDVPTGRVRSLLEECAPLWLLGDDSFLESVNRSGIPAIAVRGQIVMREKGLGPAAVNTENPSLDTQWLPDDFAYVFFTSGSDGRPKGVAGRIKSIDHYVNWQINEFGLRPGIRVSQLMSSGFDAFLRDVFTPLCASGTICIPPDPRIVLDAEKLVDWIDSTQVNLIHTVPSIFRHFLHYVKSPGRFSRLTHVFLSGESIRSDDVDAWFKAFNGRIQLINLYGPTETTMTKLYHVVDSDDAKRRSVPIGRPMEGAAALVFDRDLGLCPPGIVGEICIRTPFRSLGYFRREEDTARVFVQNPFNSDPQDLIYRTGDLGRLLPNGELEFCGRRDSQIKIRGVRIELGEIEAALSTNPSVRYVAADLKKAGDEHHLTAYVVVRAGRAWDPAELRKDIANRLPEYMIPTKWVQLERLPLMPNGKLDRKALLELQDMKLDEPQTNRPATPVEEMIAVIWSRALKREVADRRADFFELGGHSLLATQVVSALREAFRIDVPLRLLFSARTVESLAREIEELRRGDSTVVGVIARSTGSDPPLSYTQQRFWFLDRLCPGNPAYNISGTLWLCGDLDRSALEWAFERIVVRHQILLMCVADGETPTTRLSEVPWRVRFEDLRCNSEPDLHALEVARAEAGRPFDLERGPLFRVSLIQTEAFKHLLVVSMHHIVSDAWSLEIIMRELRLLYAARKSGTQVPLPGSSLQYSDFAVWQRERLTAQFIEKELGYWLPRLVSHSDHIGTTSFHSETLCC
jgi:amino acid adenylation domain-containing protein